MAGTSSIGTEFLLALSDDAAQDKKRADALLKLLSTALTGAGLLVSSDTQPGVKLPDGAKRFITVSAPRHDRRPPRFRETHDDGRFTWLRPLCCRTRRPRHRQVGMVPVASTPPPWLTDGH